MAFATTTSFRNLVNPAPKKCFPANSSLKSTPGLPARKAGRARLACAAALNPSDAPCLYNCATPQEALSLVRQAGSALHGDVSQLLSLIESVRAFESQPENVALSVAAPLALILANAAFEPDNDDDLPREYDIPAITSFWKKRPLAAAKRSSGLIAKLLVWATQLLLDVQTGNLDKNMEARAKQIKNIITTQGPAFVKVGQAIAIRPDLLPPPYLKELQSLLDQVAPFSSDEAQVLLKEELGRPLSDIFEMETSDFTKPVASASIGQVYKATIKASASSTGKSMTVAVKCQRPNILKTVTLDLITIRGVVEFFCNFPGSSDFAFSCRQNAKGLLPVLDVAATGFLQELDYMQEAANGARFEKEMNAVKGMQGVIKVPSVVLEYSSRHVLVQEWVEGVKLTELERDSSEAGSTLRKSVVRKLLNSYMVQFLETGFLHADPHPGNFMVIPDGRLCIMDYGMMTEISAEQRVAFVEYLAHLSSGQYDKTLDDLVALGFVPPELSADPAKRAIVGPILAQTLQALYSTGGGLDVKTEILQQQAQSRVGDISDKLEELSKEYPISLPPYFVLILRAFGTLEGLGLSTSADFAIVDECFPYIARRLLSDDSPRMRGALRTFIYGGGDRLNIGKVEDLTQGFGSFTNAIAAESNVGTSTSLVRSPQETGQMDAATKELLALMFAAEGNYVQELIIEEAVRAVDSLSRDATVQVWQRLAQSAPAAVAASLLPFSPLSIPGVSVIPALSIFASARYDSIKLSYDDKKNLAVLRRIAALLTNTVQTAQQSQPLNGAPSTARRTFSQSDVDQTRELVQTVLPGVQNMAVRFYTLLLERFRARVQDDFRNLGLPTPFSQERLPRENVAPAFRRL